MEVTGRQHSEPQPVQRKLLEAQSDASKASQDRIKRARTALAEFSRQRQESAQADLESADEAQGRQVEIVAQRRAARGERADSDRVELSSAARELATDGGSDVARQERLERLAREHQDGTLLSEQRIEKAADRLLDS